MQIPAPCQTHHPTEICLGLLTGFEWFTPTSGHRRGGFFPLHPHGSSASHQASVWYHYHSLESSHHPCPENWELWHEADNRTCQPLCALTSAAGTLCLLSSFLHCCPLPPALVSINVLVPSHLQPPSSSGYPLVVFPSATWTWKTYVIPSTDTANI